MEFNDDSIRAVFEGLKKKKKRVVKATSDQEQEEFDNEQGFGKKKKKKPVEIKAPLQTTQWSTADYTYKELLDRVFAVLRQNNQDVSGESRFNILIRSYKIVPPQIMREGTKKTAFANILDISTRMNRRPDHVIQFLFTELGTSGSIDGSQRLIIKGRYYSLTRFQQKQIETVLKKYIIEYVSCKTCKSAETDLTKENRMFFVQCKSCGSSRSVSAIKTGFVAQGKRLKPAA